MKVPTHESPEYPCLYDVLFSLSSFYSVLESQRDKKMKESEREISHYPTNWQYVLIVLLLRISPSDIRFDSWAEESL